MGKPGPKQVPVTARIQKSTKGGIVQPSISGMGSIAKMKKAPMKKSLVGNQDQLPANLQASIKAAPGKTYGSPAKLVGGSRSGYKGITGLNKAPKSNSGYTNMTFAEYRKSGLMKPEEAKFYKGSGTKRVKTSNKNENTTTPPVTPPSTPPVTPPSTTTVTPPVTPPSNSGSGGSNTKNVKITGRIGSDLRRKQYDAKGWAYDDTIKKPKPKPKSKPKAKAILENNKKTEKKPKLAVTPAKPTAKPTKKQVRKAKSVERKTERAAKARRKSVQALESGNLAKSRRLKRREARINKRIEKKKSGQASKAIEPK
jgi:hypothetical protein